MIRKTFTLFTISLLCITAGAQTKKEKDQKAIKDMCGCYEVTFEFTETFAPQGDYEKGYDYSSAALEWVQPVEDKDDKIVLQHLLVINDTMVIKHWRQDWLYENTTFYRFNKDSQWKFEKKPAEKVKGQWAQNVYQVDDSPRYSGSASWVHVDGKTYWENKADSPLPRREYTKRSDYNVMKRGNRHEITSYGWIHEQDNDKIIRKDGDEDVLLVQEKGINTYKKVDDTKCKVAQDWWKDNQKTWKIVRQKWDDVLAKNTYLKLKPKVDDKHLYEYLFYGDTPRNKKEISDLVDQFVEK